LAGFTFSLHAVFTPYIFSVALCKTASGSECQTQNPHKNKKLKSGRPINMAFGMAARSAVALTSGGAGGNQNKFDFFCHHCLHFGSLSISEDLLKGIRFTRKFLFVFFCVHFFVSMILRLSDKVVVLTLYFFPMIMMSHRQKREGVGRERQLSP
jgi:hypothetical protein